MSMRWSWKPRGFGTMWGTGTCTASYRARLMGSLWKCHPLRHHHLAGTWLMLVLGEMGVIPLSASWN